MGRSVSDHEDGTARRWTRSLADLPLTERSAPALTDLVSVDIPELRDFKTHSSNWDTYQRGDFSTWYPMQDIGRFIASLRQYFFTLVVFMMGLGIAWLTAAGLRQQSKMASANVDIFFWSIVVVSFLLALFLHTLEGGADDHRDQSKRRKLSKESVLVQNIAGELGSLLILESLIALLARLRMLLTLLGWAFVGGSIYAVFRYSLGGEPWPLLYWGGAFGLTLIVAARYKLFEISIIPAKSLANARAIWLGNGQIQFGCGPKGISVEHHRGFLYLVRWAKIELIYDNEDLKAPFDPRKEPDSEKKKKEKENTEKVQQTLKKHHVEKSEWAKSSLRVRLKQSGGHVGAPSQGGHHAPGAGLFDKGVHYAAAHDDHDGDHDGDGGDRKGPGHSGKGKGKGEPFDEIIIPKRFFGDELNHGCDDFHRSCWLYKWADEEAGRKAAVTILQPGSSARPVH